MKLLFDFVIVIAAIFTIALGIEILLEVKISDLFDPRDPLHQLWTSGVAIIFLLVLWWFYRSRRKLQIKQWQEEFDYAGQANQLNLMALAFSHQKRRMDISYVPLNRSLNTPIIQSPGDDRTVSQQTDDYITTFQQLRSVTPQQISHAPSGILLEGNSQIGKTRLVGEFVKQYAGESFLLIPKKTTNIITPFHRNFLKHKLVTNQ